MKKIFTLFAVVLMAVTTVKAQLEVGAIVGGMNGASAKYWLNNQLAIQADLAVGLTEAYGGIYYKGQTAGSGSISLYDFTLNPNALYHIDLVSDFKFYAGGGLSLGLVGPLETSASQAVMGKFGLNAVAGVCYELSQAPLVLAFDFRPGYGLAFQGENGALLGPAHLSYFDWKLGFAVRYRL